MILSFTKSRIFFSEIGTAWCRACVWACVTLYPNSALTKGGDFQDSVGEATFVVFVHMDPGHQIFPQHESGERVARHALPYVTAYQSAHLRESSDILAQPNQCPVCV